MNKSCAPGPRTGEIRIPASKSQAHRLLICAALGKEKVGISCDGISRDIAATEACLNALGAEIREEGKLLAVRPVERISSGLSRLLCGESGSTLRFLLPLVGALGGEAVFLRQGRLPKRPLAPLDGQLRQHGMTLWEQGDELFCSGKLRAGDYCLPGNVSSQYISGLLMALPLLDGDSTVTVTGVVESAPYIAMTEQVLRLASISFEKQGNTYWIPGRQRCALPASVAVEGDWSNAAFFLCMGAFSPEGIGVHGLSADSPQGDREVLHLLRRFGAQVSVKGSGVYVRQGRLRGQTVDAAAIPDLVPILSVLAAAAEGETLIRNAERLRLKESDRIASTVQLLRDLGGEVEELPDGMRIIGHGYLRGGMVQSANDHRIAMAAAAASCLCREMVTVQGSMCVEKSYPRFWQDFEGLEVLQA